MKSQRKKLDGNRNFSGHRSVNYRGIGGAAVACLAFLLSVGVILYSM